MYNIIQQHVSQNPTVYFKCLKRFYSVVRKSHYEVLKLRRNCSDKEIKDAFIKLSKQYHPDKNKDANAQQQFVRIVEAYNVLGKPSSRATYDAIADFQPTYSSYETYTARNMRRPGPQSHQNFYYDTSSYARMRNEYQGSGSHSTENPYYGGLGVTRIPTQYLVMLCIGIAFIGTLLQALVIRGAYKANKKKAMERDEFLMEELNRVREAARGRTNETQARLLIEKIVSAANPTIATATLGQALAMAEIKKVQPKQDQAPSILEDLVLNEISNLWYTPEQETPVFGKM